MSIYAPGRPVKYCLGVSTKPPPKPGEYRIRDDSGLIVYLGETNNLKRRASEHLRTGKLTNSGSYEYKVADGRSSSRTRREHERTKIAEHNPSLNRSRGGEGRIAKH